MFTLYLKRNRGKNFFFTETEVVPCAGLFIKVEKEGEHRNWYLKLPLLEPKEEEFKTEYYEDREYIVTDKAVNQERSWEWFYLKDREGNMILTMGDCK